MKRGRYLNKHKVFQPLEEVTRSNARFKHTLAEKYKIVPSIPISIANISAYDHAEAFLPSFKHFCFIKVIFGLLNFIDCGHFNFKLQKNYFIGPLPASFFFIFLFNTVTMVSISGVGSDRSTNCHTTTAL